MQFTYSRPALALFLCLFPALLQSQSPSQAITLDEYLNTTEISSSSLSPDGSAAVIATEAPDWKANIYRHDLWLWTRAAGLRPLTRSGTEEKPQWSPDGKWIAFISDRPLLTSADLDADSDEASKSDRLWLIRFTVPDPCQPIFATLRAPLRRETPVGESPTPGVLGMPG